MKKIITSLILLFSLSALSQDLPPPGTPDPDPDPGVPGLPDVPINQHEGLLIATGAILGIFVIMKRNKIKLFKTFSK
ncbi:hypothetical protein [Flavobacterium gelatinilyticum]|uniref:hypothetical protein n=1 Tax=Flavobacterium gelatinilyticum TaxID=3003260 RepID=UPI00247FE495|nr:hypothetical protein [Flavobacterium gelatinilyticum]